MTLVDAVALIDGAIIAALVFHVVRRWRAGIAERLRAQERSSRVAAIVRGMAARDPEDRRMIELAEKALDARPQTFGLHHETPPPDTLTEKQREALAEWQRSPERKALLERNRGS